MPAYDYVCEDCGHTFELRQSFKDDPITVCPVCGGTVRRLISPPPIIFKGSGWYITDSKSPNASLKATKTDSKSTEKAEKAEPTEPAKTEEKPAAETKPAAAPAAEPVKSADKG